MIRGTRLRTKSKHRVGAGQDRGGKIGCSAGGEQGRTVSLPSASRPTPHPK